MIPRITIHNPTSHPKAEAPGIPQTHSASDLRGKSLVILDNGWPHWQKAVARMAELLSARYAPLKTTIYKIPTGFAADASLLEAAAKQGDFAIVGIGN